ncbi:MAG: SbcC/MukB-like Walker B domain-containing protein [Bacillota bacterium]
MKLLQKMLLVNWHYIRSELLDFKQINFLTGKNGSGKSTIIDALQILMLGDSSGYFFNKAANDRSTRTLKGYLRGEVAEDEETNIIYLRSDKDFTSYIVLEFHDTVEQRTFCLGAVFDTYADGDNKHQFFYLKAALPAHRFCPDRAYLNIKELKAYLHNHYPKQFQFFDTNRDYREVMAGVLGHLNEKFFRLFRKAVPFSPIMDIKGFITEFVCDVQNIVEITHMQENIRQYKQLEEELGGVEKKIGALEEIGKQHLAFQEEAERLLIQSFLLDRAAVEKNRLDLAELHRELEGLAAKLLQLKEQIGQRETRLQQLNQEKDRLLQEKAQSDIYRKQQELSDKKNQLTRELEEIINGEARLAQILKDHYLRWRETVTWCEENLAGLAAAEIQPGGPLLEKLRLLDAAAREDARDLLQYDPLQQLKTLLQGYLNSLNRACAALSRLREDCAAAAGTLEQEIAGLKKGVRPYEAPLRELRETIAGELGAKYGTAIKVVIFAELLEIKDPRWQDAIEGYLHTQKFYLLVEPRYFLEALQIYDRLKNERKFFDIGLVDIEKVQAANPQALPNSLAEAVETDNPAARAYADYLLGAVIKCETPAELRRHRTAITPTGMLYHRFVARQLNPERWRNPYIGRQAIEAQIRRKVEELSEKQRLLASLIPRVTALEKLTGMDPLTDNDITALLGLKEKVAPKSKVEENLRQVIAGLGALDLTYLEQLDRELTACQNEIKIVREQLNQSIKEQGITGERQENKHESIPVLEKELQLSRQRLTERYPEQWREGSGEPRFAQELERRKSADHIIAAFNPVLKRTETIKNDRWSRLIELRTAYNRDFKGSFNATLEANSAFDAELTRLKDTLLLEYRAKIKEAKERAQVQFQEDFISKLKANIENVEEQIKELNKAIKDTLFGRDKYKFTVSPNLHYRRFYDMITDDLLIEGYNLFSQAFQDKHRDTVEELFRQIVDTGEGILTADQRQQLQKNLEQFTDYRTYLDFDLVNIDDEGRESRLSRVLAKKSGGETQTPFYISVLASFLQLYRVNYDDANTLRLIVFDEAYSKMDHQRIQESIKLIREMGLQVILSAPTEKIGDIAPYVDRNLCVTRVKRETIVRAFDPRELEVMGV